MLAMVTYAGAGLRTRGAVRIEDHEWIGDMGTVALTGVEPSNPDRCGERHRCSGSGRRPT